VLLVPPSSRFFCNSGPEKVLFLLLDVKCDQQTHKKMMSQIMTSIIQQSPITILPMFLAGEFHYKIEAVFFFAGFNSPPIRLRLFFAGFEGFFMR
jgi:hypothetical protein